MLAYLYNDKTKEYVGLTVVLEDPLESQRLGREVLAFPPNCTLVTPPEVGENEVALFDKDSNTWSVEKDYRGCTAYTKKGNSIIITETGDIPTNYSLKKPVTLQEIKVEMIDKVRALYKELLNKELTIGQIKTFVSKRKELLTLISTFGEHATVPLENTDDETVLVTKEEVEEAEKYIYIYQMLLAQVKNNLVQEIRECTNKKNVVNIEIKLDINDKLEELMKLTIDEVNEYFAAGEE